MDILVTYDVDTETKEGRNRKHLLSSFGAISVLCM